MKNKPFISVIIPCYNEARNLRLGALAQVSRFLEDKPYSWEVIVVDDGSVDESRELIRDFTKTDSRFIMVKNRHQGKASTVITGMLMGKGSIVLFSDLDQATPISEIDKLIPWFNQGFDVVIGSRNSKREGAPFLRRTMAWGFMWLRTVILGLSGVTDTQCGFKAFRKKAAKEIFQCIRLYDINKNTRSSKISGSLVTAGFDVELLFLANRLGYAIKEVPVTWHYVETRRVSPWRDSWQGLRDLIMIRINSMRGVYNKW